MSVSLAFGIGERKRKPSFLLSFLIFVQVINRHKERWDEHEIRVETVISEERVQNTEHEHRETHCDVVERHVNLFLQFLELLYAL